MPDETYVYLTIITTRWRKVRVGPRGRARADPVLYRLVRIGQFVGAFPVVGHVIHDQGLAHAADGLVAEAVPGIGARHEGKRTICLLYTSPSPRD